MTTPDDDAERQMVDAELRGLAAELFGGFREARRPQIEAIEESPERKALRQLARGLFAQQPEPLSRPVYLRASPEHFTSPAQRDALERFTRQLLGTDADTTPTTEEAN